MAKKKNFETHRSFAEGVHFFYFLHQESFSTVLFNLSGLHLCGQFQSEENSKKKLILNNNVIV